MRGRDETKEDGMNKTYVLGGMAYYDRDLIEQWKQQTDLSSFSTILHWHWYRSNWRILHVDGFEPGYGSRTIRFDFKTSSISRPKSIDYLTKTEPELLD
jgi:hypothetical protein